MLDLSVASPLVDRRSRVRTPSRSLTERVFGDDARRRRRRRDRTLRRAAPALRRAGVRARRRDRPTSTARSTSGSTCSPTRARRCSRRSPATSTRSPTTRRAQDYGPVIILRHVPTTATEFFTLYGHLSRESLDGLARRPARRAPASRSRRSARPSVNGGWTPHLHFQIITDLLGLGTDFPGVAPPSQRAAWIALCPDPNLIVACSAPSAFRAPSRSKAETLAARATAIGGNLSIAYREPVEDRARMDAVPVRRRRAPLHRRVQQRAARRPLPSARRRGRRGRRCAC